VIHADPAIAKAQGFAAPILQGSCTMALACREIISGVLNGQAERIRSFGARFTAVVYPGDRVQTEIWIDGPRLHFRCSVPARQSVVLDHGLCELTA
jgi:acyl dehydratase